MKKTLTFAIVILLYTIPVLAQNPSWCGTEISDEWMQNFYNRNKDHLTHKGAEMEEVVIPITYHLVGKYDGTGYYELQDLFRSHCELQELYAQANIKFYIESINYINNTPYYDGDETSELFVSDNKRNTCNVYIVNQMDGVCGYSYVTRPYDNDESESGPNRGGVMLAKNCMQAGNSTYRHEMGHYLNLPHTFYGWEGEPAPNNNQNAPATINGSNVERADGSNCTNSGDGFCDTPPDYISDRWNCNVARTFKDPVGETFTLDEKNFMAYSNDGCAEYLTAEQLAEVNAAPEFYRPNLLISPVPIFDDLSVITEMIPSNNSRNINPNNVTISWPKQNEAQYYHIQATRFNFVNPTFDVLTQDTFYILPNANLNAEYQYRVKPISFTDVCTDFSEVNTFRTAGYNIDFSTTQQDCPGDFTGAATVDNPNINYDYYWFNDANATSPIQNQNQSSLNNLGTGKYSLIVVRNNTDTVFIPFVIAADEISVDIVQTGKTLEATITGGEPPYSYIWDNGSQDLILTNPSEGSNTITVTDNNNCLKTVSANFSTSVGIHQVNENILNLSLIPNPINTNNLKINLNSKILNEISITCTDLSGKILIRENYTALVGENNFNMNVGNLSNGIYFISIIQNGLATSAKLVVNK